jgi:hypothetical protein
VGRRRRGLICRSVERVRRRAARWLSSFGPAQHCGEPPRCLCPRPAPAFFVERHRCSTGPCTACSPWWSCSCPMCQGESSLPCRAFVCSHPGFARTQASTHAMPTPSHPFPPLPARTHTLVRTLAHERQEIRVIGLPHSPLEHTTGTWRRCSRWVTPVPAVWVRPRPHSTAFPPARPPARPPAPPPPPCAPNPVSVRMPFGLPGTLVGVLLGTAVAWACHLLVSSRSSLHYEPNHVFLDEGFSAPHLPSPTFGRIGDGFRLAHEMGHTVCPPTTAPSPHTRTHTHPHAPTRTHTHPHAPTRTHTHPHAQAHHCPHSTHACAHETPGCPAVGRGPGAGPPPVACVSDTALRATCRASWGADRDTVHHPGWHRVKPGHGACTSSGLCAQWLVHACPWAHAWFSLVEVGDCKYCLFPPALSCPSWKWRQRWGTTTPQCRRS